jgi:hypothetical protein
MKHTLHLKVHGRGNAWPVPLGEEHPFYDRTDYRDLSNAAFSLIQEREGGATPAPVAEKTGNGEEVVRAEAHRKEAPREEAPWEVLVDAGHGTIQSLVSGRNRIPHCICLTHGHMDHTLSVDWVVQSYWRKHEYRKPYPLYASRSVYDFLLSSYPHLRDLVEERILLPGEPAAPALPGDLQLTSFPVFHGPHAAGASMLLFEAAGKRVLFTGDLVTPLLRKQDRERISGVDLMVVDCNNRFPWPRTNHWSFAGEPLAPLERTGVLKAFLEQQRVGDFLRPHRKVSCPRTEAYLEEVASQWDTRTQAFSILEFCQSYAPHQVLLVHYSGAEDRKHHGEEQLTAGELEDWANGTAVSAGISSHFRIPETGEQSQI